MKENMAFLSNDRLCLILLKCNRFHYFHMSPTFHLCDKFYFLHYIAERPSSEYVFQATFLNVCSYESLYFFIYSNLTVHFISFCMCPYIWTCLPSTEVTSLQKDYETQVCEKNFHKS